MLQIMDGKINSKNIVQTIELKAPELANDSLSGPAQIVEDVNIKIENREERSNWVIKLTSPGSLLINVILSDLIIADGSSIYIYNDDLTTVMGPIEKNNSESFLTTPEIHGDIVYIQVNEGYKGQSSFNVFKMAHGLIKASSSNSIMMSTYSTDCIPSIICYPAWNNESNSVGLVRVFAGPGNHVSNGSGTLVNNEAEDGRPFFLTAMHVLDVDNNESLSTT